MPPGILASSRLGGAARFACLRAFGAARSACPAPSARASPAAGSYAASGFEAVLLEKAIEIVPIDAGVARRCADVPLVAIHQAPHVRALERHHQLLLRFL